MSQTRWDHTFIPDQTGKLAVVTGANSGLGWHISLQLARQGAHVVMACRDKSRAAQAMEAIRAEVPDARLSFQALNLSSLSSVRSSAAALMAAHPRIDLLVNNAGVMFLPYALSADGFEIQMASNHLGHFLLTGLLLGALEQAPAPRIVTMSSGFNHYGRLPLDGFRGDPAYSRHRVYCDTKLANIVFARELAQRLSRAGSRIASVAAHPGYAATNLQFGAANLSGSRWLAAVSRASMRLSNALLAQPAAMGALPALFAATQANVRSGDYIGPDGLQESRGYPKKVEAPKRAFEQDKVMQFWAQSELATGFAYDARGLDAMVDQAAALDQAAVRLR